MQLAVILLGLAAVGGFVLAGIRIRGRPRPPTWMALGHGAVAVAGLGVLISVVVGQEVTDLARIALGIFVIAALGGLTLFLGFHVRQRPLPIPLIVLHGLAALFGWFLLFVSTIGSM